MSDDLVKRLDSFDADDLHREAADRIEELEAANRGLVRLNEATEARAKTAEAKLAKAVEEAEKYQRAFAAQSRKLQAVLHIDGVRTTLAELKG